jgi:hypothetical protein
LKVGRLTFSGKVKEWRQIFQNFLIFIVRHFVTGFTKFVKVWVDHGLDSSQAHAGGVLE